MNFDDYEKSGHALYGVFARAVRDLLEEAIAADNALPRPQSIQQRRKTPASLKAKLARANRLDSPTIETEVKDLAGVRLIFYTNTDIDRFLNARVIPELFKVQWDETRVHYPTAENDELRYKAFHYAVSLNAAAAAIPALAQFAGLRCEIQVQTLLDHAWAETNHDMVYKTQSTEGFGARQAQDLDTRMKRVMDTYLRPAGFEFDKVRRDHDRLMQGKALFDQGSLDALDKARDNNERGEIIRALGQHVIPNFDDIAAVYGDIRAALLRAVRAARETATVPVKSIFGEQEGVTATEIAASAVELIDELRYVDVAGTLDTLMTLYIEEPKGEGRTRILDAVRHLAENDMTAWEQVGPGVQMFLTERIEQLSDSELDRMRPLALATWRAALSPDIDGITGKSESITLHKGAVPASDAVRDVRARALAGLTRLLIRAETETQRREVAGAFDAATAVPAQADYDGALCAIVLDNMTTVFATLRQHIAAFSYETRQHLEQQVFYDYEQAGELGAADRLDCRVQAETARTEALAFRDALNSDVTYVRYKMLVGFETVVLPQWDDPDFDFDQVERFRRAQTAVYREAISDESLPEWRAVIARCAETESDDGAIFSLFGDFLRDLARDKPLLALNLLDVPRIVNFLPGILNGLSQSRDPAAYRNLVRGYLDRGEHLTALAVHMATLDAPNLAEVEAVLQKAMAQDERAAIGQCIVFAVERSDLDHGFCVDRLFVPAVRFAIEKRDPRILYAGWFLAKAKTFLPGLSEEHAALVLTCQLPLERIDYRQERVIALIAQSHPKRVWEFLKARLDVKADIRTYQAVPFQLHALAAPLASDSDLAVTTVRAWFKRDDGMFRFTGGRLIHAIFPKFTDSLGASLLKLIASRAPDDIAFAIRILENYPGEAATLPVIREAVRALPEDDKLLGGIYACLGSSGIVGGRFGLVEASRRKRHAIEAWSDDADPKLQAFAKRYTRDLEQQIASEQRRAEQDQAMRKLDYGEAIE